MRARGLPDDCEELRTLRAFRDCYVRVLPDGPALIEEYYRVAPVIVDRMSSGPDAGILFASLYGSIDRCLSLIREGQSEAALRRYVTMVKTLKEAYT